MKPILKIVFLLLFFFSFSLNNVAQVHTWVGDGDGKTWGDVNNWQPKHLPTTNSIVLIEHGDTVFINQSDAKALSVAVGKESKLKIASGSLNIDNQNTSHGLILFQTGSLLLTEGSQLSINNTRINGIYIDKGNGKIDNRGTIITQNIGLVTSTEGFVIRASSKSQLILVNQTSGQIINHSFVPTDFLLIPPDALENSLFENHGQIRISQLFQDGFHLFSQMRVDNFGTIQIDSIGRDGFILDSNVVFTNHSTGNIQLGDIGGKSVVLNGTAKFINEGKIKIEQQTGGHFLSEAGIYIAEKDAQFLNNNSIHINGIETEAALVIAGNFTNNHIVDLGMGGKENAIMEIRNTGILSNKACGIINIFTSDSIANNQGIISNQGIITSLCLSANFNSGVFRNNGIISTPNESFLINGNQLVGTGIITPSPIPATLAICNFPLPEPEPEVVAPPIPTLNQWGILILGLLILNVGVYFISQLKQVSR